MGQKVLVKIRNTKTKTALAVFVFCALLFPPYNLQATSYKLALVSARDNIPGSFTTAQSLYADEARIYLASVQGTLFVLERSREKDFPLLESINLNSALTAVVVSKAKLYVASASGAVHIFEIPQSDEGYLRKVETKLLNNYGVGSLAVTADGKVVAGLGQARVAASGEYVFVTGLNKGDDAFILDLGLRLPFKTDTKATGVYRLRDGQYIGTISNYFSGAVSISASGSEVFITKPGCCGTGVAVYESNSLEQLEMISVRFSNAVTKKDNFLIVGTETGTANLVLGLQMVDSVDLRKLTGNNGLEDIEIRALWADSYDSLIFAASSWGNDVSRSESLPSFFVLEITQINSEQGAANNPDGATPSLSDSERGRGEVGDLASGIINIPEAQASEIEPATIDSTNISDNTTTSPQAENEGVSSGFSSIFSRFAMSMSKALKFIWNIKV